MPTISPVITVTSTPGIEITTSAPGVDYNALISGLGEAVFRVVTLYYKSAMLAQMGAPLKYTVYNTNGDIAGQTVVTPVSGSQFLPSQFVQLKGKGIFINGQSGINFNFLPLNQIQFIFYCIEKRNQDVMDKSGHINNFKMAEGQMGMPGFFDSSEYIDPHTQEVFPEI